MGIVRVMRYNPVSHAEQNTRALCVSKAAYLSQLNVVGKVPSINGYRSVLAVPRDNGSAICGGHFAMSRTGIDEVGNVYGRLTVIERSENKCGRLYWLCLCSCGNETIVRGSHLRGGSVRSCGCLAAELSAERAYELGKEKAIDEVGNRYGKLTVTERHGLDNQGVITWLCLCDCGNEVIARGRDLRYGNIVSCKCERIKRAHANTEKRKLPKGDAALNSLFSSYKHGAKKRGLQFTLTKKQFRSLTQSDCHYCGRSPFAVYGNWSNSGLNGCYVYNGIDRKNNDFGYVVDNCVPCCKSCNSAKSDMSYSDFIDYLDCLVAFRSS